MPNTEGCVLGAENKMEIDNLKNNFSTFRQDIRNDMDELRTDIKKLVNCYSKRLPLWAYLILTAAITAFSSLATYVIVSK